MTTGGWQIVGKRYWIVALLLLFVLPELQTQAVNPIPGKKLTALDFKGDPDPGSQYLARTYVKISYAYYDPKNCIVPGKVKLTVDVNAVMSDRSWMKTNMAKRWGQLEELLSHEQGHYDIFQLFAARLQRTMEKSCFNKKNYTWEIDSVYKSMNRFYDSLQLTYDAETNHMRNKEMQVKWKKKITDMRNSPDQP